MEETLRGAIDDVRHVLRARELDVATTMQALRTMEALTVELRNLREARAGVVSLAVRRQKGDGGS